MSPSAAPEPELSLADRLELEVRSVPGVVDVAVWIASDAVALEVLVDEHWARGDVEAEVGAVVERLSGRWPARMRIVGAAPRREDAGRGVRSGSRTDRPANHRVRLLGACPERAGGRLVCAVGLALAERAVEVDGDPGGSGAARATLLALRRLGLAVPYRLELVAPVGLTAAVDRRAGTLVLLRGVDVASSPGTPPVERPWPERLVGAALGASEEESSARAVLDALNRVLGPGGPGFLDPPWASKGEPVR